MRVILKVLAAVIVLLLAYLAFWPVAVKPVAWNAPENPGYTGDYAPNDRLAALQFTDIGDHIGPEDADIGPDGMVYMATHTGDILRAGVGGAKAEVFANTDGRPLGLEFGPDGTLYVADAYRGLIAVARDGTVRLLADVTEGGSPIRYADDVDVAPDGRIYFSDASTRFGAREVGSTLTASVLDLVEHSANGRVLVHDPETGTTRVFADGLTFANGVAVSPDGTALMVVETGEYRVLRYDLGAPDSEPDVLLTNTPGFPDNINNAPDGNYWVGLVSPRNPVMDKLANKPQLRRVIMRLPDTMKPAPTRHGFVLRMAADGTVLETLQDPAGDYALTTGAVTAPDGTVIVTSLSEPRLGYLRR
ncbi:SMP-30/gluconolactonase/LRE family protein [Sediminimonas sp.]|uniref:SMP-30/gluconolactonase/LRE family protein n=1 Tax=Sediminimonas sp. TaxID=2823379 RepID=UPI0025E5D076|nr:SMP-30/gluconolactonase/LRE family protein [Sediminimonas sp.]